MRRNIVWGLAALLFIPLIWLVDRYGPWITFMSLIFLIGVALMLE